MKILRACLFVLVAAGIANAQQRMIHASASGSTIQLDIPSLRYAYRSVMQKGVALVRPEITNAVESRRPVRPSSPDIPFLETLIALPNANVPTAELVSQNSTVRNGLNFIPVRDYRKFAPGAPKPNEPPPVLSHPLIEFGTPGLMRGVYVVPVRIYPLQYNPGTRDLRAYSSLHFRLHITTGALPAGRVPAGGANRESKSWASFAKKVIANYNDGVSWRTRAAPLATGASSKPKIAIQSAPQRIKIFVNHNGVFRVLGSDLQSAFSNSGVSLSSLDPRTFHLYIFHPDTVEIPIFLTNKTPGVFQLGDTLEFYGIMHYGEEGQYYDFFTDDNIYWLTWGGSPEQHLYSPQPPLSSTLDQEWCTKTDHYEQDHIYYTGNNLNSYNINIPDFTPGKGWYWARLQSGLGGITTFYEPITIGGLPDVQANATFRFSFQNTTNNPDYITFSLNGDSITQYIIPGWSDTVITYTLPCKQLRNGENDIALVLQLQPFETYNGVDVGYFEITTPREFVFTGDLLEFTVPKGGASQFTIQNVPSPSINVFNSTTSKIPSLISSAGGTFVRLEARGAEDLKYVRMEVNNINVYSGPFFRGFNIAEISPDSGKVIQIRRFDTWADTGASRGMVNFLDSIPNGSFVLIATCDESSSLLSAAARAAIQSLGSRTIQTLGYNDAFAFVARKGDTTFTPAEDLSRAGTGAAHTVATIPTAAQNSWKFVFQDSTIGGSSYIANRGDSLPAPRLMELRLQPTILSTANAADWLVISHRNFIASAHTLAQWRAQHNGYDTAVVDVEDIYDAFNGGIEREVPIQQFLRYAYNSWSKAPAMVCLLGDACWDSKDQTTDYGIPWRINYIPTYGEPVSDYWFACFEGADLFPDILIGRLGETNPDTAQAVVNKIISYESQPPGQWNKNFLLVTGGLTPVETADFYSQVIQPVWESSMGTLPGIVPAYILPPPICGDSILVTRDEWTTVVQLDKSADMQTAINNGVLWMDCLEHGATNAYEMNFGLPNALHNAPRFPFFATFACNLEAFAEPEEVCSNETYVNEPQNGMIAAWGGSTFGDANYLEVLREDAFSSLSQDGADSLLQWGFLTQQAQLTLWATFGNGATDSFDSISVRNTIMEQNLLGDPATGIALRTHPVLELNDSDVVIRGESNTISDQDSVFFMRLLLHNDGFSADSNVRILVQDDYPGGGTFLDTVTVPVPCLAESILVNIPIHGHSGQHSITITLNFDGSLPKDYVTGNTSVSTSVTVYSSVSTILRPQNFGSMAANCGGSTLSILVPQTGASNMQYFFQIDTSALFRRPLAFSPPLPPNNTPVLQWQVPFRMKNDTAYYWRVRLYDPAKHDTSIWSTASFAANGSAWQQIASPQFSQDILQSLTVESDGVHLGTSNDTLYVESRGALTIQGNIERLMNVQLNSQPLITSNQTVTSRGFFFFVLSDTAFAIDPAYPGFFDTYTVNTVIANGDTLPDSLYSREMTAYINSIPIGRIVIAAASDEVTTGLTDSARSALKTLGAKYADSLVPNTDGFRSSYALIGVKGGSAIAERWTPGGDSIDAKIDTALQFHYLRGQITSQLIGPATAWSAAHWKTSLPQNTSGKLFITGLNRYTNKFDPIAADSISAGFQDLSHIDPRTYWYIQMTAELDRASTTNEPVLQQWAVNFIVSPELVPYAPSLSIVPDSITQGATSILMANVFNAGCTTAKKVLAQTRLNGSGGSVIAGAQTVDSLPPMAFAPVKIILATNAVRGLQQVNFALDPYDSIPELDKSNNTLTGSLLVQKDTNTPGLVVTVDGRQIQDNDYVRPTPEIIVKVIDNNPLPQSDSSSITVVIDGRTYTAKLTPQYMTFNSVASGNVKASAILFPDTLTAGTHTMVVYGVDPTGNTDSLLLVFQVVTTSSLVNVMNAPNPFPSNTYFTYQLTGESAPQSTTIKVYTVAGRLIKVIDAPPSSLRVGFNVVPWDGTDAEGNRIANGVYIYKLIVHLPTQELIQTQKLAVLR